MPRVMNRKELARAHDVREAIVDEWTRDGCPCFRLRESLWLYDELEVAAWLEERQVETIQPLVERVHRARTPDDVAAIASELPALVARGLMSRVRAREIRENLVRLASDLAQKRRSA